MSSARHRLRGPPADLEEDFAALLRPEPTTVNENGTVRFGDSLLLLSHGTELPLQADASTELQVVDDSHSQRRAFTAMILTTGRVLDPCARNSFSVARAKRKDDFAEDDLELHYGQHMRLLASNSMAGGQLLHLHLEEPASPEEPFSTPVLFPRAAPRTTWRVLPAPLPPPEEGKPPVRPPAMGQVVRVNEHVSLENVETGRVLMSATSGLVRNAFGAECEVFAEDYGRLKPFEVSDVEVRRQQATWSFVNEQWADAVNHAERGRTGGVHWKEDAGDDFAGVRAPVEEEEEDIPAFHPLVGSERQELEDRLGRLTRDPRAASVVERIWPAIRAQGVHGARKFRRSCVGADVIRQGVVAVHGFEGLLANLPVRLQPPEFARLCEAFESPSVPNSVDYLLLFQFLGGIMPEPRLDTLKRAYRRLKKASRGGHVTVETLMKNWNPRCYPGVSSQDDVKEARFDFATQWEVLHHDGHVSPEDFLQYYSDVSIVYQDSADFIEMLRVAWDL